MRFFPLILAVISLSFFTKTYAEDAEKMNRALSSLSETLPTYKLNLEAGLGYSLFMPGGYERITDEEEDYFALSATIEAADSIPIFSEFSFSTSLSGVASANEKPARLSSDSSARQSYFLELKSPFTTDFLAHDTRWYLQFALINSRYQATANGDIYYKDGSLLPEDSKLSLGEHTWRIALAIDTPFALRDRIGDRSRFGIFYQESERGRSVHLNNIDYILGVTERSFGIFYNFKRPLIVPEFVIDLDVALGVTAGKLHLNSLSFSTSDFDDIRLMIYVEAGLGLSYSFNISEHIGIRLAANYSIRDYSPLNTATDNSFSTSSDHIAGAAVYFNYKW